MTAAAARLTTEPQGERETAHERVYRELSTAIITGRFVPGRPVTLRGVATNLGVSPMPVREALRQLVAERALVMFDNRRVAVPSMSPARFAELCLARTLLEPQLATLALPRLAKADIDAIAGIDDEIGRALERGDIEGYMRQNHAFHFRLYRAAGSTVLLPLVESLWLQVGPFVRIVVGRLGTGNLVDHHQAVIRALRARDEAALRAAVRGDVLDGQEVIGRDILKQQPQD
ncbi:MAG: GntR family transcriptional regulator [Geminicoccaceae bacterium]